MANPTMKTMLKPLKNYIMVHSHRHFYNAVTLLACIVSTSAVCLAQTRSAINEKAALKILRGSDFGNSITKFTRLFPVYRHNSEYLFYYVSNGWKVDHGNEGLVIFKNNRYNHDYYINHTCIFKVNKHYLICQFRDFPSEIEKNRLADVFAGKKLLIGGSEVRPYRGSKTLYR